MSTQNFRVICKEEMTMRRAKSSAGKIVLGIVLDIAFWATVLLMLAATGA